MISTRAVRIAIVIAVMGAGSLASGFNDIANAGTVKSPKLVVKPSGGLRNGQSVRVTGTGFTPKDQVFVVECLAKASGQAECNTATATPATINAKGVLPPTKFKVVTGAIGTGTCGTKAADLKNCAISVGNATGGDSTTARITFLPPKKAKK